MPQPTVQLIVNRHAGSASRRRVRALRAAFEGAGARVLLSDSGEGEVIIADAADHVCVVGGDGTLRHVAAAVRRNERPVTLSIYPGGTINLVARECGYSSDAKVFVARVLGGTRSHVHHVGLIGDIILSGVASVGPDSFAVAGLSPRLKRLFGRYAYAMSFLALLGHWRRPQLRVSQHGREIVCEAVYVAKGRYFAGPWSFAPQAALEEPLLHVVALHRATRLAFARFVWALWRRYDLSQQPNLTCFSCTELAIDGEAVPLQADGDIVAYLPVRIVLHTDTLSFA